MEKINLAKSGMILVLAILLSSFVFAFGVSSPYWKDSPLIIFPGETKIASLTLQNMVGTEDITVQAEITDGSEIASIEQKEYTVKLGTKDTEVPIEIKVPKNASANTKYKVVVSFKTVTPGGAGVVLGTGMDTTFDVEIIEKPKEEMGKGLEIGNTSWLIAIAIVIIVVIIAVLIRKKRVQ